MSKEEMITAILLRMKQRELDKVKKLADEAGLTVGLTIRQIVLDYLREYEKL